MAQFLVILICLVAGFFLRRSGKFPSATGQVLSSLVIYIALPALVLVEVPKLFSQSIDNSFLVSASAAWVVFGVLWVVTLLLAKLKILEPRTASGLLLSAGLGNTAFIGIPMIESLEGKEALSIAIIGDQAGTFLVLSTLGILVALRASAKYQGGATQPNQLTYILNRILKFPPFIALLLALAWGIVGLSTDGVHVEVLKRFAGLLVPMALLAVGWQLNLSPALVRRKWKPLSVGLGYKLLLAPLLIWMICLAFDIQGQGLRVIVLEAAMAPMITSALLAIEFDLDADLAQAMLGIGIPLSLITVPLWRFILMSLGF